ncbi:MAG: glycosyltransferase family 2 protein [Candidatus Nanoarchaeia archaeon]|nr:glycosyltransferase family 2 protein [Candidatus Nanoarchaeia archaeon]
MHKNIKISVVTVCFNSAKTIELAIKSVLNQTYKHVEYIVIDGQSTDDTLKIVNKYKKKISKIVSEKDKGIYDAMNKGVDLASGDVIYFLNSDDVLVDKQVLLKVAYEFSQNDYDLVFGNIISYYPKEKLEIKRHSKVASISELKNGDMPPHQASFVKRYWLKKYYFNLKYRSSADFDFFCDLLSQKIKIKKLNLCVANMQAGGFSSGLISCKETEEIILERYGFYYYIKLFLKNRLFFLFRSLFSFFGVRIHISPNSLFKVKLYKI